MSAQLDSVDAALLNRARFAAKLAQAQSAVRNVPKSERNQQQNYNFAPTESIFSMLRPILADNGLAVLVDTVGVDKTTGTSANGKSYDLGRVRLDITLIDTETGYSETAHGFEGEGLDYGGDKALPKAYTMAMKYWARVMFMIDLQADAEADRNRTSRRSEPPTIVAGRASPVTPKPEDAPTETPPSFDRAQARKDYARLYQKAAGLGHTPTGKDSKPMPSELPDTWPDALCQLAVDRVRQIVSQAEPQSKAA